jgi:iron complex transport system substrate-binding protein
MLPAHLVTLRYIQANITLLSGRAALVAAAIALLLSAWSVPAAAGDRVFTDSAGRRVELPARIERVFAAGPPAAVLLYSLVPDRLIGWPQDLSADAKAMLPARYASLPVVGRLTGHENGVAVAAVVALRPDLIIDVGDIEPEYVELANRVQKESGIPYILIDGSLSGTADAYRSLGSLLDVQPAAADLARRAGTLLDGVRATLSKVDGDKHLRAYYARGKDGLETAMPGSVLAEGIEFCGLVLAAPPSSTGEHAKLSIEDIVRLDPDIVVTSSRALFTTISTSTQWSNIRAVHERHIFLSPNNPFGWIDSPPGINRLIGVRWLAGRLYPAAFPGDLRDVARDFYAAFFHIDLSPSQLDQLLSIASVQPQ